MLKDEKCYVYYATEKYFEIAKKSIESIRKYSDLPIYLYYPLNNHKLYTNGTKQ